MIVQMLFIVVSVPCILPVSNAFVGPQHFGRVQRIGVPMASSLQVQQPTSGNTDSRVQFTPIFDFSNPQAVESFDRIDDAIMGGISTSTIRYVVPDANDDDKVSYASWSGICRVDGGGFCGTRTLPFVEPLQVEKAGTNGTLAATVPPQGFYISADLPVTTNPIDAYGRSVLVLNHHGNSSIKPNSGSHRRTKKLVQNSDPIQRLSNGARCYIRPWGERMDVSRGIYQIGLTLSKFRLAQNMTVLDNFRAGYFELQIKSIGLDYTDEEHAPVPTTPRTLSREEMKRSRPLLVKTLLPLSKLFSRKRPIGDDRP
jgi:hypothetical protein